MSPIRYKEKIRWCTSTQNGQIKLGDLVLPSNKVGYDRCSLAGKPPQMALQSLSTDVATSHYIRFHSPAMDELLT